MSTHLKSIAALTVSFKAMNQLSHPVFYIMHMSLPRFKNYTLLRFMLLMALLFYHN